MAQFMAQNRSSISAATLLLFVLCAAGVHIAPVQASGSAPPSTRTQRSKASSLKLLNAIQSHNIKRVRQLLAHGADPNATNARTATALMYACDNEDPLAVKLLLKSGARINARDGDGRTPLMHAALYGLGPGDFQDFMSQGDVNKRCPMEAVMRLLLHAGAKVNIRDHGGRTAIAYVAQYAQSPGCTRLLLDHGAKVQKRDGYGGVIAAAEYGLRMDGSPALSRQIIALLKKAGATD